TGIPSVNPICEIFFTVSIEHRQSDDGVLPSLAVVVEIIKLQRDSRSARTTASLAKRGPSPCVTAIQCICTWHVRLFVHGGYSSFAPMRLDFIPIGARGPISI
ncbi:hypothetical protein PQR01_36955, partial [Paraburkholderia rhynchosiae]